MAITFAVYGGKQVLNVIIIQTKVRVTRRGLLFLIYRCSMGGKHNILTSMFEIGFLPNKNILKKTCNKRVV